MQTFTFEQVQAIAAAAVRVQPIVAKTHRIVTTEAVQAVAVHAGGTELVEVGSLHIAFVGQQGNWHLSSVVLL